MIVLTNVYKSFGTVEVLKEISLTIAVGETVAILGPSGGGKSTLLRTINLMTRPDAGRIEVDGECIFEANGSSARKSVSGQKLRDIRQSIGMVFQQSHLFTHRSVLENVIEGPVYVLNKDRAESIDQARALLDSLGLGALGDRYPSELSGGQQQRVAICRALAMNPRMMLFDEPTSSLDPELVSEVLLTVRKIAERGMTIAIVTHEMSFARRVASRVAFMDDGHLVEIASPSEFFRSPQTKRAQAFLAAIRDPFEGEDM